MPELPEVETVLRGLAPQLCGRRFTAAVVREAVVSLVADKDLIAKRPGDAACRLRAMWNLVTANAANPRSSASISPSSDRRVGCSCRYPWWAIS